MSNEISRKRFDGAFANSAIDLKNEGLGAALTDASLDVGKLDALDGKSDGRVTGQQALDDLYDEINRLDTHTAGLASKQEQAVWGALRGAALAPAPISARQGQALASAARQIVAEDRPARGKESQWAKDGAAICKNPELSAPAYAGQGAWKCNVLVGEAFHRAGLPFPLNPQSHYETANGLPQQSKFFQPLARLDDVRAGDLISVQRKNESGHVEIVTGVNRGADGRVVSITSAGAHMEGSEEGELTAAPLVRASRATVQNGAETLRILRPMAPPTPAGGR